MTERVLVVIPAYNEEMTIARVLLELRRVAPAFDRVVVDDGSRDATARIVEELGDSVLRLSCNLGYGLALQTGLQYALRRGYDIVVTMDADGQHRAEDVPAVVAALQESDADLVIGSRFSQGRSYVGPWDRRLGQLLFSQLTRLWLGRRIYDTTSGFKALRAATGQAIVESTFLDFHTETIVRLGLLGFKIMEHPVTVDERTAGSSMYSLGALLHYPIKTFMLTIVATMDALVARRIR